MISGDGSFVVNGLSKGIDDAANHGIAYGHRHDSSGALDLSAFFDFGVVAKHHRAYLVFFQVHGDSGKSMAEVEQFAGHDFIEAVDAGDAIPQRDDRANFVDRDLGLVVLNLCAY